MAAKMAGELEKGNILFAHGIENADGGVARAGQPNDTRPEPPSWP